MLYLPKKTQYCVYLIELNTRFVILIQLLQGQKNIALSYNCWYNNKQSTILLLPHRTKYNSDLFVLKQ